MALRKILIATLGHVDHGKTSLLDKIRKTAIAKGEAGGITQAVGVSIIPYFTVQQICGKLLHALGNKLAPPGLLVIDTPGHAAFTSLRKRGGSLADIAIVVIDINEGLKPQTIESITILKSHKVPFVIAANKIDLIPGWKHDPQKFLLQNLQDLDYKIQGELERRLYDLVAQVQQLGLGAERFDRVQDFTKQIAIIPVSAHTGQGIPELLMVLTGLAQRFLEKQLQVEERGPAKGTILEVKEEKGLGTTIDAIIYNGSLRVNDTIIIAGLEKPIVTKVRALLEPTELAEMREKKSKFQQVKEVTAATGVKIVAPGLEAAVAGMPLRSGENIQQLQEEVQRDVQEVIMEDGKEGVMIKADTIGGLEALRTLLQEKKIPIAIASLGNVTKTDLSHLQTLQEQGKEFGVLLGFNITVPLEIAEAAQEKKLHLITNDVIYQIIDNYEKFRQELQKSVELQQLDQVVRPWKVVVMKGYVFRQSHPAIMGIDIEAGKVRTGDPLMTSNGKALSIVKGLQDGKEAVSDAEQGKQLALSMDHVTIGRQVNEGDTLYSDIPENDFQKLKELKSYLSQREIEALKEIIVIKRKENPVWGVG